MFFAKRKVLVSAIMTSLLTASLPSSAGVTLTGDIKATLPTANITTASTVPVAFVKEYSAYLDGEAGPCTFTFEEEQAMNNIEPFCLIEWVDSDGLVGSNNKTKGIPDRVGEVSLGYTISTFTGSIKEKVLLNSGAIIVDVLEPVQPRLVKEFSSVTNTWHEGNEVEIFNVLDRLNSLKIEVEERNYDQKIIVQDHGECLVLEGQQDCTILTGSIEFGSKPNNIFGNLYLDFFMNSANDYFPVGFANRVNYDWDYRTPVIDGVEAHIVNDPGAPDKVAVIEGLTVDIENERAKAVISSPHHDRTDVWWLPETVELEFRPRNNALPNGELIVDDHILFEAAEPSYAQEVKLTSVGVPVREGDQWIYQFDLHSVPDGLYQMVMTASDRYDNSTTGEYGEIDVLRTLPQVKLFKNYKEFENDEGFYFTENLMVASFNDYLHSSSVNSVTLNGTPLALDNMQADAKKVIVDAETLGLEYGEEYDFVVSASDSAGNVTNETYTGIYRPVEFGLTMNTGDTVYQSVQKITAQLAEIQNEICDFYPSFSYAVESASSDRYSCVFKWTQVPDGLTQNTRSVIPLLDGSFDDEGTQEIAYQISLFDHNGHEAIVTVDSIAIETVAPTPPVIDVPEVDPNTGMYVIPLKGGALLTSKVSTIPADSNIKTGVEGSDTERVYNRRQSLRYAIQKSSAKVYVDEGSLWEERDVPIYAEYDQLPSVNTTETVRAYFVPERGLSMKMEFTNEYALDNTTETVKVKFGKYNRSSRTYDFDAATMGTWKVRLVKMVGRTDYEDLTPEQTISSSSEVEFELSPTVLSSIDGRIMAVAEIQSPGGTYEKTVISNKMYMRIFNGGDIEGSFTYKRDPNALPNQIIGKVPFSLSVTYKADTKEDNYSIDRESVFWEFSEDGTTWSPLTQMVRNRSTGLYEEKPVTSLMYRDKIEVKGSTYVRIALTNKYTGAVNYSDPLNILAYDRASLKIEQMNTAFYGEAAEYNLAVKVPDPMNPRRYLLEDADPNEMEIQWSYDGEDWFDDSDNRLSLYEDDLLNSSGFRISSRYLWARTRLHGEAVSVGESGWSSPTKIAYKWIKPSTVRVRGIMPTKIEEGTAFTAGAEVVTTLPNVDSRVKYEWVLGGSVIAEDVVSVDLIADPQYIVNGYYNIGHRAWIEGLRDETLKETNFRVKTWRYTFPTAALKVLNSSAYAPNSFRVQASARLPRIDGIEFTKEFYIADDGGDSAPSFTIDTNNFATYRFNDPGIKLIGYRLADNRGNEQVITEIVELFPPFPMVMNITESYSNPEHRFPLDITFRGAAEVSHPDDRVVNWDWKVTDLGTGEITEHSTTGRLYLKDLGMRGGEADYKVELLATTEFGQTGHTEVEFHVNQNIPPECDMNLTENSTQLIWELRCTDTDGQIVKYNWYINGERISNYQKKITMTKSQIVGSSVTVKGEGVDDGEDVSSDTQTYLVVP